MNPNQDNVVTLEEFVNEVNATFGLNNVADHLFAEFGKDYDWTSDYLLIARIFSEGHDLSDYRQAYKVFENMSMPHAIDTFYPDNKEATGITIEELASFMDAYFHMDELNDAWV